MAKCEPCNGSGQRQIYDVLFVYGQRGQLETCPDCRGTGEAPRRWHCELVASTPAGTNDLFLAVEVVALGREDAFAQAKAEMIKINPTATYIAANLIGEL